MARMVALAAWVGSVVTPSAGLVALAIVPLEATQASSQQLMVESLIPSANSATGSSQNRRAALAMAEPAEPADPRQAARVARAAPVVMPIP
jgi:hypothetical protein